MNILNPFKTKNRLASVASRAAAAHNKARADLARLETLAGRFETDWKYLEEKRALFNGWMQNYDVAYTDEKRAALLKKAAYYSPSFDPDRPISDQARCLLEIAAFDTGKANLDLLKEGCRDNIVGSVIKTIARFCHVNSDMLEHLGIQPDALFKDDAWERAKFQEELKHLKKNPPRLTEDESREQGVIAETEEDEGSEEGD